MRRVLLTGLLLLSVVLVACSQRRTGESAVYDTVIAGGYNTRDSLALLRTDLTRARDSLAALRASLALATGAQGTLLRDTALVLRQRDTLLVNSLSRALTGRIADSSAMARQKVADSTAALRVQLNLAFAQIAAYQDTLVRLRYMDSVAYAYADNGFESSMGYIGELQMELAAEKASTVLRFAVATDSINALRVRIAQLQARLDSGGTTTTIEDLIAPAAIADLAATGGVTPVLTFTSPDANPGTAAVYDIRYSTATITEYGDSLSGASGISVDSVKWVEASSATTVTLTMVNDGSANDMLTAVVAGYDWGAWSLDSVRSDRDGRFTLQGEAIRLDYHAEIYTLDEPSAGTHTVTYYFRNTPKVVCGLYRLSNVAAVRTTVTNGGVAWPSSFVTVPSSVTGELIIDVHSLDPDISSGTWGSGQSEAFLDYAGDGIDACGASSYRDGVSGNVDMTLTYPINGEDFAVVATALSPVTGGSVSTAWANATQYQNEPTPKVGGQSESIGLAGIAAGTYFFAVKSADGSGNISALSNVDSAIVVGTSPYTPPDTTGWRGGYGMAYADSVTHGTIWVDKAYGPGGDGTAAKPYMAISTAITAAASGDTVIVKGETYGETVTAKSGVLVTNYAKQAVTVTGNSSGTLYLLNANGVTDFRVQGIKFTTTRIVRQNYDYLVNVNGSTNIRFAYCNFTQELEDCSAGTFYDPVTEAELNSIRGIVVSNSEHFTMVGCYLFGWTHTMVLEPKTADTSFYWINGNHFAKQSWCPLIIGWAANVPGYQTSGVLIENNLYENSWGEDGIQWQPIYGYGAAAQATSRHFGHLIRNNVFRDLAENALDFKATGHIRVEDNYFYRISGVDNGWFKDNGKSGGAFEVGAGDTSKCVIASGNVFYSNAGSFGSQFWPGWKSFHNTMVNNMRGTAGDRSNNCANLSHWGVAWGNAIKNNVMVDNYVYVQSSAASSALDIDYNRYEQTVGDPLFSYYASGWVEVSGLTLWQNHFSAGVLGRDSHSDTGAVSFENVPTYPSGNHTAYDFKPASGSPLVDAAGPLSTATNAGLSSTTLTVGDAWYFRDAMGMSVMGVLGDSIQIGATSPVQVTAVNYTTHTLTLSASRTWNAGDGVWLFKRGKKVDDIGAIQR